MSAAAVASGLHISPEPTLLVDPSNLASRLGAESRLGSGVVIAAASAGKHPEFQNKLNEKFIDKIHYAFNVIETPKEECHFMEDDVAHNLNDYARIFAKGTQSRIRIKFIGDSLLEQYYQILKCAAKILGMHTEETKIGTGTGILVIKHSPNATGGVELHMQKIWKFRRIPDPQSCTIGHLNELHGGAQWHCDISWAGFCSATEGYDYVFANLAHHALRGKNETHMSFEKNGKYRVH